MARLMIFDDCVRGLDLPEHAIIVGRSKRVDVPIRDRILSRKHCSIIPMESGFSLVDLKSQNGTFVNGSRIEKAELEYDDVIEIGETVIVILDTDSWDRGEGITRLRHPVKAQELIQRINTKNVPVSGVADARNGEPAGSPTSAAGGMLEDLVMRRLAEVLVRKDPRQEEIVGKVVEKMLSEGWPDDGWSSTRTRVKELLDELVSSNSSRQGGKTADSGSPEEQE